MPQLSPLTPQVPQMFQQPRGGRSPKIHRRLARQSFGRSDVGERLQLPPLVDVVTEQLVKRVDIVDQVPEMEVADVAAPVE